MFVCFCTRRSTISMLLAAPAMFFWGIGTSTSAGNSIGWTHPQSSVALAVATIVIPALDAFSASRAVERWLDKVSIAVNGRIARWRFLRGDLRKCSVSFLVFWGARYILPGRAATFLRKKQRTSTAQFTAYSLRIATCRQCSLCSFQFDVRVHTKISHSMLRSGNT